MQLGVTIPLQKFLQISKPPYGEPTELFFCWEVHRVLGLSRSTLIAVNASNRYALVFSGMQAGDWKQIDKVVADGIEQALTLEGYAPHQVETYFAAAGETHLTKTHGRKPVAGLNRAVDVLCSREGVDERQLFQPATSHEINSEPCRPAGFDGEEHNCPREFLKRDMARLGI